MIKTFWKNIRDSIENKPQYQYFSFTCDKGVWWTLTNNEHVLMWCPLAKLNDSEGMDSAGALEGGWSSEGLTWISVDPSGLWT